MLRSPRQQQAESGMEGQDQIALANLRLGEKELVVSKESLSKLGIPIFAIVGSEDPALEAVNKFKNILPAIELRVIEGESHISAPENPEFVDSIQDFFARNKLN
jgi:pimeloyl-ACP methyl ester carboxylesterase